MRLFWIHLGVQKDGKWVKCLDKVFVFFVAKTVFRSFLHIRVDGLLVYLLGLEGLSDGPVVLDG